ncbi:MAG: hypothetical protein RKP46_20095 [Candidatus Accumulibacter sp.]|nr:hypothetical protein [Accumulibacter sp.]MDS4016639.1 hypothetical protein [Accumulibacter sp.]
MQTHIETRLVEQREYLQQMLFGPSAIQATGNYRQWNPAPH